MSKRRHHEVPHSEHHEAHAEHPEHHEHSAEHEAEHHEHHEHHEHTEGGKHPKSYMKIVSFVVIAAVFFAVGYFAMNILSSAKTGDELVFISPPGCTNCAQLEPIVKNVATTLNIPFVKTGFGQAIENPGYFMVYEGNATIAGVGDEYTFKTQICLITKNTAICNQAKNLTPPTDNTQTTPATTIAKADKTNVKFFTMAYCPYGNQAETGLIPVYELLKDKVTWEPHYVIYANYRGGGADYCMENGSYCSMHGIQELHEDIREMCIWKYETHDKFFSFLGDVNNACTSSNVDTCWEAVAQKYSINTAKIKDCQQNEAVTLLKAEYALNQQYGVQGSPTVLINNGEYSGGRAAEDYKAAICSGFNTPPSECSQSLGNTSATASGGCG